MKCLFLSIILFGLVGCHGRLLEGRHSDDLVILVAGQSNAVSLARCDTDRGYSETGKVEVLDGEVFVTYTSANRSTTSLAWLKLGDMIASPSRKVKIINIAVSGTDSGQWASIYLNRLRQSIDQHHPRLIIWIQGESDTLNGLSSVESSENYHKIAEACADTRLYVALDGGKYEGLTGDGVRLAQAKIIKEGLAKQGPDIDLLRNTAQMDGSLEHFTGTGFKSHADAWLDVFLKNKEL